MLYAHLNNNVRRGQKVKRDIIGFAETPDGLLAPPAL